MSDRDRVFGMLGRTSLFVTQLEEGIKQLKERIAEADSTLKRVVDIR